ncbi:nuclease-related domain-containing protein [Kineococcus sp. SYSU DK018]|uniref:nuclease-related domain-containing protein n=1 Tax=Kineococcus sp. SYSU DK018 TaxID=3383139 RepID=UPI003D7DF003
MSFERFDVDHIVLAPKGVFALEVKALFGAQQALDETAGLDAKVHQARRGAQKVTALLRAGGTPVPVKAVLVLAGPGAPHLPGRGIERDGVLIAALRDSHTWRPLMVGSAPGQAPALGTATAAARHLLTFCERRDQHQRSAWAHRGHRRANTAGTAGTAGKAGRLTRERR